MLIGLRRVIDAHLARRAALMAAVLLAPLLVLAACGEGKGPAATPEPGATQAPAHTPTPTPPPSLPVAGTATPPETGPAPTAAPGTHGFAARIPWFEDLEPQPWWRESAPYSCLIEENPDSPWTAAGLVDLGGSDPLSLIPYYGNGSYLVYISIGFEGCTPLKKHPDRTFLDTPVDPTYYSLGDLVIAVDIARVPESAQGWLEDDNVRVPMSMEEAVNLLNTYVGPYYGRISGGKLRMRFVAGNEFTVAGEATPADAEQQQFEAAGVCIGGCQYGLPGGLSRIRFNDVASDTGGEAGDALVDMGLAALAAERMETVVHEIGHAWMHWPHSFTELAWSVGGVLDYPNPYSNVFDFMSSLLGAADAVGWTHEFPSALAINRYAAGWIEPAEVALHLTDDGVYTLAKPLEPGYQFLVVHSGRPRAFTTLEVAPDRAAQFRSDWPEVYDPSAPDGRRPLRYEGVLVNRYDQTAGTGSQARFGPALYDTNNPNAAEDVGWGKDDYSLIPDGETRDIGGGVSVSVKKNPDGSYDVTVSGGKTAEFERWCYPIWFSGEYDTGCALDGVVER